MSAIKKIEQITDRYWTVEISVGDSYDYIFKCYFNNQPRKTRFEFGAVGTFAQCVDKFYRKWKQNYKKYWNL